MIYLTNFAYLLHQEVNGNIRRVVSPPLSPRNSEILLAGKNQIRELTEEL